MPLTFVHHRVTCQPRTWSNVAKQVIGLSDFMLRDNHTALYGLWPQTIKCRMVIPQHEITQTYHLFCYIRPSPRLTSHPVMNKSQRHVSHSPLRSLSKAIKGVNDAFIKLFDINNHNYIKCR